MNDLPEWLETLDSRSSRKRKRSHSNGKSQHRPTRSWKKGSRCASLSPAGSSGNPTNPPSFTNSLFSPEASEKSQSIYSNAGLRVGTRFGYQNIVYTSLNGQGHAQFRAKLLNIHGKWRKIGLSTTSLDSKFVDADLVII